MITLCMQNYVCKLFSLAYKHGHWQGTDSRHYGTGARQRIVNTYEKRESQARSRSAAWPRFADFRYVYKNTCDNIEC